MPILFENDYFTISVDPDQPIVRTVRSEVPYDEKSPLRQTEVEIERALASIDRPRHGHLVDMRAAPMNNSESFESGTAQLRALLARDFATVVVVVRTAVGTLQSGRILREDAQERHVHNVHLSNDEAAAVREILDALSARPRTGRLGLTPAAAGPAPIGGGKRPLRSR